ncbi:VOC family protein [Anaeromyxobacter oryzae]|uniref:Glyoxalase n=1 Tax=Anaeromyxobacter oryzae TaxID=2918170 RepID=A0ABN6MSL0_9BACT|nr:VOC family protein [Anaeromyxobacter oryzae]BDG03942.1 glyoxalase [Anaeromyxobacter oryzae]
MLTQSRMVTILPVVDLERARKFYEEKLGLEAGETQADGSVVFRGTEGEFALSPRPEPAHNPYTAMGFEVEDVAREVKDLERRGVAFEDYDTPELKTVGHIAVLGAEKAAWFKDPDGNILCVHENASRARH